MASAWVWVAFILWLIGAIVLLFAWFSRDNTAVPFLGRDKQSQYLSAIALFVLGIGVFLAAVSGSLNDILSARGLNMRA